MRDIQKTAARETNVISVSSLILFVMAEKPPSMKFISSVDPGAGTVQRQHE